MRIARVQSAPKSGVSKLATIIKCECAQVMGESCGQDAFPADEALEVTYIPRAAVGTAIATRTTHGLTVVALCHPDCAAHIEHLPSDCFHNDVVIGD